MASSSRKKRKYHPNATQAKKNRHQSAKNAAKTRKKRGTQWRHGNKSKSQVKRSKKRSK